MSQTTLHVVPKVNLVKH